MKKASLIFYLLIILFCSSVFSQGFLRRDNQDIVNGQNENVILRGIGLGGWMVQEGYMMKTEGFANPQWEIREKIVELIGEEDTDAYFDAWLTNFCQKVDIDSIAAWGFNSIRLPMHYNLYTLPIEDEPVAGENTWLEKGFELTDSLLAWCEANELYLILDLHAAPGGQGYNAAISDYDPSKPSLWESQQNRDKTVALWKRLAERYVDEPWIGGYDLINETNWNLPGNSLLRQLFIEITDSIRTVDTNHIIFIEGNGFANDFSGLTPPWDDNMAYSFHKYWSNNDQGSLGFVLPIRTTYNVPLWCGESGENSNAWHTEAIRLLEDNNIGWAWWPYKKIDEIDGPLDIERSESYQTLLDYWSGNGSQPSPTFAYNTMMELAENARLENCVYRKDYTDAMIRQVQTTATKPFKNHVITDVIFASDYDLGTQGYAYFDNDFGYTGGDFTAWNNGWAYRNDGVDVEVCDDDDENNNGYNVGFINEDEWINYTVTIEETGVYDLILRVASEATGRLHLELDGRPVTGTINVNNTGGWQNWDYVDASDIVLEEGQHQLKLYFGEGSFNLNYFIFWNYAPLSSVAFNSIAARSSVDGNQITASFNKQLQTPLPALPAGFSVSVNGNNRAIASYELDESGYQIVFTLAEEIIYGDEISLSYSGGGVTAVDNTNLVAFADLAIENRLPERISIPGIIEAEDFSFNQGFELETCTDTGGGQNLGYTDTGDYVEYLVTFPTGGTYSIDYRVASEDSQSRINLEIITNDSTWVLHSVTFPGTGGWQNWTTVNTSAHIPAGMHTLRITVLQPRFNLNWFNFDFVTALDDQEITVNDFHLWQNYPNPFNPATTIRFNLPQAEFTSLDIYNGLGQRIERLFNKKLNAGTHSYSFDASNLSSGLYFYRIQAGKFSSVKKMLLMK